MPPGKELMRRLQCMGQAYCYVRDESQPFERPESHHRRWRSSSIEGANDKELLPDLMLQAVGRT
jgi:hypothetical protein